LGVQVFLEDELKAICSTQISKKTPGVEFEGIRTKVMTPEYLLALLLKAGRDREKIKREMFPKQAV